ncbi:MAG: preprotein translocase subunit YajC [Lachnospiraceae bacterium]|nr:preprotein translocase subunit YajC [Lachnospiraceae bacterium]
MNFVTMLLEGATDAAAAGTQTGAVGGLGLSYIISIVAMLAIFYFLLLRPQKKEQKRVQDMLKEMEVGDVVVTTSGFYGVLIDITEDDVIVEFGSNKNCRIPMRKSAIAQVEKAEK